MKTIKAIDWAEVPEDYTGIVEWTNGSKYWLLNGQYHREDGPALECVNGDKWWYLDDKRHRIDGPAVDCINGTKEYWVNGKNVTKEAQEVLYGFYKLKGLL